MLVQTDSAGFGFTDQTYRKGRLSTKEVAAKMHMQYMQLLANIDLTIEDAPEELDGEGQRVIRVVDGGTFRVFNSKPVLKAFRASVVSKFPRCPHTISSTSSVQKGNNQFKAPELGDRSKTGLSLKLFSMEPRSWKALSNGNILQATNDRVAIRLDGDYGGSVEKPIRMRPVKRDGGSILFVVLDSEDMYLPPYPNLDGLFVRVRKGHLLGIFSVKDLCLNTHRLQTTMCNSGRGRWYYSGTDILSNKSGTLGFRYEIPKDVVYEINVQEEAQLVGHFGVSYLFAIAYSLRELGVSHVEIRTRPRQDGAGHVMLFCATGVEVILASVEKGC